MRADEFVNKYEYIEESGGRLIKKIYKFFVRSLKIILSVTISAYTTMCTHSHSFAECENLFDKLSGLFGINTSSVGSTLDYNNSELVITMLDVGHGDCFIVSAKDNNAHFHSALIDTGSPESAKDVIAAIKNNNVKCLDFIIITHPHSDHMGALPELIKKFPTQEIFIPNISGVKEILIKNRNLKSMVNKKSLKIIPVSANQKIFLGKSSFEILAPKSNSDLPAKMPRDINDSSIVSILEYKKFKVMFTGDASSNVERDILKRYPIDKLKSSVLKVAHHGSKSSSSTKFLNTVDPNYALISSGSDRNCKYPHPQVSRRLGKANIPFFNTRIVGNVCIFINDESYNIVYNNSTIEHKYP